MRALHQLCRLCSSSGLLGLEGGTNSTDCPHWPSHRLPASSGLQPGVCQSDVKLFDFGTKAAQAGTPCWYQQCTWAAPIGKCCIAPAMCFSNWVLDGLTVSWKSEVEAGVSFAMGVLDVTTTVKMMRSNVSCCKGHSDSLLQPEKCATRLQQRRGQTPVPMPGPMPSCQPTQARMSCLY